MLFQTCEVIILLKEVYDMQYGFQKVRDVQGTGYDESVTEDTIPGFPDEDNEMDGVDTVSQSPSVRPEGNSFFSLLSVGPSDYILYS